MRKSTRAQIEASRRNGARSRGPVSAEGKAIVARNALKHGLSAKVNVLSTEDRPAFEAFLQSFLETLSPQTDPEFYAVEEMAAAKWKIRRAWALENARLEYQMDLDTADLATRLDAPDNATRTSLAWTATRPELEAFHRYHAQLLRQYERAYRHFQALRNERVLDTPTDPEPQSLPQLAAIPNKPDSHLQVPPNERVLDTPTDPEPLSLPQLAAIPNKPDSHFQALRNERVLDAPTDPEPLSLPQLAAIQNNPEDGHVVSK